MKNKADYSKYECPYSHLEKECGHELKGPEGYEDTYGVWCSCGFRGPVFYLEPENLKLTLKEDAENWRREMKEITFKDLDDFRNWLWEVDLQSIVMVQKPDGSVEVKYKEK